MLGYKKAFHVKYTLLLVFKVHKYNHDIKMLTTSSARTFSRNPCSQVPSQV